MVSSSRWLLSSVVLLGWGWGCGEPTSASQNCTLDQCQVENRQNVLAEIADRNDLVADFLRANLNEHGEVVGDYTLLLNTIVERTGCALDQTRSSLVLSNTDFWPKTIFTTCSSDPISSSRFFLALPQIGETERGLDINPRLMHVAVWDDDAQLYRPYSMRPNQNSDGFAVNATPQFCQACHQGPVGGPFAWQPLMNEIARPWAGWNAEPEFRSLAFDQYLSPEIAHGEHFAAANNIEFAQAAARFEPAVRAGIDRVTSARLLQRKTSVSIAGISTLLRPLFCDETVNFVSQEPASTTIPSQVVVDANLRWLFQQSLAQAEDHLWPDLLNVGDSTDPLLFAPVRGESMMALERGLVARGVLSPHDVMRVRAIDWQNPMRSAIRCDSFASFIGTLDQATLAKKFTDNQSAAAPLLRELLDGAFGTSANGLWVIDHAGSLPVEMDVEAFAARVKSYTEKIELASLRASVRFKTCEVRTAFPLAPLVPEFDCR